MIVVVVVVVVVVELKLFFDIIMLPASVCSLEMTLFEAIGSKAAMEALILP